MPRKGERTWTDDGLRDAVRLSTSFVEVLRTLGLSSLGNLYQVKAHIERLELDTSHFSRARKASTHDYQLRELVPACSSMAEVIERLQLGPTDVARLRKRITILGISTSHFVRPYAGTQQRRSWTDEQLRAAVASSRGVAATIRALGLIPAGGNYDAVQRRIRELGLDTTHFTGAGWNRGAKHQMQRARPLSEVLVADQWTTSSKLKARLIRERLKTAACELCGWAERRPSDGVIPIELDHANGDHNDNRLENLRILCPNCHALQPTHRGLNQMRRRR